MRTHARTDIPFRASIYFTLGYATAHSTVANATENLFYHTPGISQNEAVS